MKETLFKSWRFVLALVLIFISGKVAGYAIAVHRHALPMATGLSASVPVETNAWSRDAMNRLTAQLGLTSDQMKSLEPVVASAGENILRERERALFQIHLQLLDLHDELAKQLRPDQKAALEASRVQLKELIASRFNHIIEPSPQP